MYVAISVFKSRTWVRSTAVCWIPGYSDAFDGTPLAAFHDVVVVTINYRVGPPGQLWAQSDILSNFKFNEMA